jgi:hypothetical protein
MQCREARHRLEKHGQDSSAVEADKQLIDHLQNCPDCARDAVAGNVLNRLFVSASTDDTLDMIPLAQNRTRIEALASNKDGRKTFSKTTIGKDRKRRPILSFGTIIAAALLLVLTLVPFKYNRIVGYEIAFDGVNKELGVDTERICDMLFDIGLNEADIDDLVCDTTCSMIIIDLKTKEEVRQVIAAFTAIDHVSLVTDVMPVRTIASGSLLDHANETILKRGAEVN